MNNREIFIDKLRQLSKEEMLERYIALLNTEKLSDYVSDLEAKLTQKDKQLEKLKSDNHALISDNAYQEADIFELNSRIEQLQKQLAEKETEIGFLEGTINSMQEDISYWEQKLTEKDKEIEKLKEQRHIYLNRSVEECNKITDLEFELQHKDQDKISFCVEQLEKVKDWCENHKFSDEYDYIIAYEPDEEDASGCVDYLKYKIDNQINELKGEQK